MVHVAKIGVEDEKVFQVWSCADEWQEYLSNFLSIPFISTDIHIPQCVERWAFSQVLEYWPELINLDSVFADVEAFKTLLLR